MTTAFQPTVIDHAGHGLNLVSNLSGDIMTTLLIAIIGIYLACDLRCHHRLPLQERSCPGEN